MHADPATLLCCEGDLNKNDVNKTCNNQARGFSQCAICTVTSKAPQRIPGELNHQNWYYENSFWLIHSCANVYIAVCLNTHKKEKKKSSTLHSSQCENAVAHKSEVTTTTGRTNEAQANTCRFLWRRALNSPNWFSFGRGAASSSSCQLKASRYIRQTDG